MSIFDNIKNQLKEYGIEHVEFNSDLTNDLGLDSLDRTELFMWADKEYDIYINDFDAEDINTIFDFINVIDSKFLCNCITNAQKKRCSKECG